VASRQSEAAAWAIGRRYRIDIDHAAKVRQLALQLFDGIRGYSTLADRSRTLLAVAAILHDIGIFVATTNHEVHGGTASGPFPHDDRFIVVFDFDITPKVGPAAGQRITMQEAGLYTVKDGKVTREEFFHDM